MKERIEYYYVSLKTILVRDTWREIILPTTSTLMSLLHRKKTEWFGRLSMFRFSDGRLIRNRYRIIAWRNFCLYMIFVISIYVLILQSSVNTLLIPPKRPHDRNFVSRHQTYRSVVSMESHTVDLILVTSVTAQYVDRLENLIGSIHYHAVHLPIIVFDLGMTASQRSRVSCMVNTHVENFPFEDYPSHVTQLQFYAFKALLLKEALNKYRSKTKAIFYLDAGSELRSSLDPIVEAIIANGYFLTRQNTLIVNHTDEQTFTALNVSKKDFSAGTEYQTSGGIIGFSTNYSNFYTNLLTPFVLCSLNIDCIAPRTSRSSTTHRFDQSVLSILVHKAGYLVEKEDRFHGDFSSPPELDAKMVIFSRRWHCPKVYTTEILFRDPCNFSSSSHFHSPIVNAHEVAEVYPCGKLTIGKIKSAQIELPVNQVYALVFLSYILLMTCLYCCVPYVLRFFTSVAQKRRRRICRN